MVTAMRLRPIVVAAAALLLTGPASAQDGPPEHETAEDMALDNTANDAVQGEFLITLSEDGNIESLKEAWQILDATIEAPRFPEGPILVVINSSFPAEQVTALMRHTKGVESAAPNFLMQPSLPDAITETVDILKPEAPKVPSEEE